MFPKLTLFFLIVFVATLECQTNDVQNFIASGEKKIAEQEKQYYDSTAGSNFDEQTLRQLIDKELNWKNQIDARKTELENKLKDSPDLTAEEKAKLENDIGLLTTAYFKVFLALHLNLHVVFDHVQLELLNVLNNTQSLDIQTTKTQFEKVLTSLKVVTEDIKVQGGRSLNDVKGMLAAAKKAKNQALVESLQYMHINDDILHVCSELSLERANIDNQIRRIKKLLLTTDATKKALLLDFQNGLKAQSDDNAQTITKVMQRMKTDL